MTNPVADIKSGQIQSDQIQLDQVQTRLESAESTAIQPAEERSENTPPQHYP
jgi:uncharacterized coiled-coil protein SlyX